MVRIYGQFSEHSRSSQAVVSRGFMEAFPDAHQYELDRWGNDLDEAADLQPGAVDKIGIFLGPLFLLHHALRAKHEQLWVMLAPNSNTVGPKIREELGAIEHLRLLAPSFWAQRVLQKEFPDKEVWCVPHGISQEFLPQQVRRPTGFDVLHMSSSALQRKGTEELVQAWAKVQKPDWRLFVSVPESRLLYFRTMVAEMQLHPSSINFAGRLGYSEKRLSQLYSTMSFVCQPSRGEGFGMVPVEARACGTPVIMTGCTGHEQHVESPGVVEVPTGSLESIDDFPGAKAPHLSVDTLAVCLQEAYTRREELRQEALDNADFFRLSWNWVRQLHTFHRHITKEQQ